MKNANVITPASVSGSLVLTSFGRRDRVEYFIENPIENGITIEDVEDLAESIETFTDVPSHIEIKDGALFVTAGGEDLDYFNIAADVAVDVRSNCHIEDGWLLSVVDELNAYSTWQTMKGVGCAESAAIYDLNLVVKPRYSYDSIGLIEKLRDRFIAMLEEDEEADLLGEASKDSFRKSLTA